MIHETNIVTKPNLFEMRCSSCAGRSMKPWARSDLGGVKLYALECLGCGKRYRIDENSGFEQATTLRVKGVNYDGYG